MRDKFRVLLPYFKHPSRVWRNVRWRLTSRTSPERHVFVVGAPRSGTTLMQVILAAHPRLASFQGESGLFTWQDLFDLERRHMNLSSDRLKILFEASSDIIDFFDKAAKKVKQQSDATRFVEKTPQHVLKLGFILRHFPRAKVVHMYRDGRDCCCSARRAGIPHGEDVRSFAQYWQRCIRARGRQGLSTTICDVRYETLTSEPEQSVRRIMDFLEEDFSPQQIAPESRQDRRSGDRKFARLSKKIDGRSQGRWKDELSTGEVSIFARIAGKELCQLGYTV